MKTGIRDFLSTFGGRVGAMLLAIISQIILARVLGPSGRGSLYVCQVFQSILALVFAVGCDVAAVYFVSSRRFSLSEGVTYTLLNGTVSSILAIIAGWLLISSELEYFTKATPAEFKLSLLFLPITLFSLVFHNLLTAVGRFGFFGIVTLLRAAVQVICTLIFVWWAGWGVSGGIWATIAAYGTGLLVSLCVLFFIDHTRLVRPEIKKAGKMFFYGLRYYFGKLSNIANMQVGSIVLGFLATESEIGYFSVAFRLLKQVESISQTLATILFPRVAAARDGKRELIARVVRATLAFCGGALFLIAVFARPLIVGLYDIDYAPAVPLLRILCLAIGLRCLGKLLAPYLIGTDHPGFASIAVGAGAIINVGLIFILLPVIGISGAAWGVTGSYLISTVILLVGFCYFSKLSLAEIFTYHREDFTDLTMMAHKIIGKFK
ncbi:MAG: oligosaccharide flippase family protein [Candidatus Auribacterota bacterium]|nr:oligosaccharide flippase family protein [Candidatus Auribacterota bacterium]